METFHYCFVTLFKEEEITLENPADVPVYIQFIPLALYSNPSVFVDKLISR